MSNYFSNNNIYLTNSRPFLAELFIEEEVGKIINQP